MNADSLVVPGFDDWRLWLVWGLVALARVGADVYLAHQKSKVKKEDE